MTQIGRENIVSTVDGVLHVPDEMSEADLIFLVCPPPPDEAVRGLAPRKQTVAAVNRGDHNAIWTPPNVRGSWRGKIVLGVLLQSLSPTGLYEEGQVKPEWLIRAAYCGTPAFILASMA